MSSEDSIIVSLTENTILRLKKYLMNKNVSSIDEILNNLFDENNELQFRLNRLRKYYKECRLNCNVIRGIPAKKLNRKLIEENRKLEVQNPK